jgi:hypothetical protein
MDRDRSPEGRFSYLAEKRIPKALRSIKSVANLSDRKNYTYTEEQVEQIVEALEYALENLKADFGRNMRQSKSTFQFHKK